MRKFLFIAILIIQSLGAKAAFLLIPMDEVQTNHLKAYGIAYWNLTKSIPVDWLLNYRGGSFAVPYAKEIEKEAKAWRLSKQKGGVICH